MAAGYKGKVAMSAGAFYAPNVPSPARNLTWKEKLAKWEARAKEKYGWGDSENVKSDCMDKMQAEYPGKYELVWSSTVANAYHLSPVFKDPKHETMWRLQHG